MEMTPVTSSQIHSIGHDPETGTLAIRFKKNGQPAGLYHYPNWTPEKHAAFMAAESKGTHFGEHVRKNTAEHPHTKVS